MEQERGGSAWEHFRLGKEWRLTMTGDALQELLALPGARYSCVADPATGRVLGESGSGVSAVPAALLTWAGGAARFLVEVDADDLDDLIVTSRRSYHLVRRVGTSASGRLLVYLCLDRARGNLAAARRELASARLQERLTAGTRAGAQQALPPAQACPPAAERGALRPAAAPPGAMPAPATGVPLVVAAPPEGAARPDPQPRGASRSAVVPALLGNIGPAVPQQRSAVTALPRRSGAAPPPPPPAPPPTAPPPVPAGLPGAGLTWADDVGTLRRLLAALRRMS